MHTREPGQTFNAIFYGFFLENYASSFFAYLKLVSFLSYQDLNETEKAQRKQAEAENLRRLLVQLTTEMRAKHSPGSGGDKVSTSPFKEFESIRSEEIQIGRNRNSTFTNDGRTLAESDADDHDKQEIRYSRGSSNQQSRQVRPIISRGNNNNDAVEPNRDTAATAASFENPPSTSSAPRTHDGKSEIEAVRAPQQSDLATPSSSASVSVFDEVDFRWPSTDTKSRQQQPASSNVEAVEVDVIVKEEIADSSEDLSQTVKQLYKSHAENLDLIQRADPDLVVPPLSIPEAKEKMRSPVFKRDPTSTKSAGLDQRNKMAADNAICPSQQDPFNFMSTVQRKLDTQKQFDKPKEVDKSLMLSEGPLSSASSTTSSSAHDKSQTSTSKGHVSAAHKRRPSIEKAKGEEEEIPVRDTDPQEDRQKTSQVVDFDFNYLVPLTRATQCLRGQTKTLLCAKRYQIGFTMNIFIKKYQLFLFFSLAIIPYQKHYTCVFKQSLISLFPSKKPSDSSQTWTKFGM